MVCEKCSAKLIIYKDILKCPVCNNLNILEKDLALKIIKKQFDWFNNAFTQVLNQYEKRRLITWILGWREKLSSKFFTENPKISLNDFLSMNVLIKRIMLEHEDKGKELVNDKTIDDIIYSFSGLIKIAERFNLIQDDFGHIIAKKNLEINNINYENLMKNYIFVMNEDWVSIMNTFDEHLIMNEEKANKYLKKFEKDYEKAREITKNEPIKNLPEGIINKLYPTLISFFCALNKNKIYKETFDFNHLKEANIPPDVIFNIIKNFPLNYGLMNLIKKQNFKEYIKKNFKNYDSQNLYNILVFSHNNQNIFPLFVEFGDNILISICFNRLISLFYYPIYYKGLFVKETQRISEIFEKEGVPNEFIKNGFKIFTDIKDKKKATLQIDNIAWKNENLYVIETKIWDIKPLFEHKFTHLNRTRDLKGIVDGEEYSVNKNGTIDIKRIPNLLSKIDFVRENLEKLCPDYKNISNVKGLVITKSYPPLKSYKDVSFLSFNDIKNLI